MASYTLFNTSKEINEAISGVNEFFNGADGFTGDFNLIGGGYASYLNALDISASGDLNVTGDAFLKRELHVESNGYLTGNFNVTGGFFVNGVEITGNSAAAAIPSELFVNTLTSTGDIYIGGEIQGETGAYITGVTTITGSLIVNGVEITGNGGGGGGGGTIPADLKVDTLFATGQNHTSGELTATGNVFLGESGVATRFSEFVRSNRKRQVSESIAFVDLGGVLNTGELFLDAGQGDSERINLNSGISFYNINVMGYNSTGHAFGKEIKGITTSGQLLSRSDTELYSDDPIYGLDVKVINGDLQLVGTGTINMEISADVRLFESFAK